MKDREEIEAAIPDIKLKDAEETQEDRDIEVEFEKRTQMTKVSKEIDSVISSN